MAASPLEGEKSIENQGADLPNAHLIINPLSPLIRKQLDRVVEAASGIFADALEIEIAFDEIGKGLRQQHVFSPIIC